MVKKNIFYFMRKVTSEKNKDFGIVVTVVLLVFHLRLHSHHLLFFTMAAATAALLVPIVYTPFSMLWYGIAEVLSIIMSRIILTVVFFTVITPIGLVRRIICRERLLMERWKKDTESLFTFRDKKFTKADIEKPY
jgi:hypothetical protein